MSAEQTPDIADVLLPVLMNEYGGEREDWTGMGSLSRVAAALAPVLAAAVREAEQRANLLAPWGPFEMGGFEGCTDRNLDVCACGTDQQPVCRICAQEIESGEQAWARQWPCYDTLPLDDPMQDWDVISWHDDCPSDRADRITEPVSHEAATSGEEASKA